MHKNLNTVFCVVDVTGHPLCEGDVSVRVDIGQKWREDKGTTVTEQHAILLQGKGGMWK